MTLFFVFFPPLEVLLQRECVWRNRRAGVTDGGWSRWHSELSAPALSLLWLDIKEDISSLIQYRTTVIWHFKEALKMFLYCGLNVFLEQSLLQRLHSSDQSG